LIYEYENEEEFAEEVEADGGELEREYTEWAE
jgi:hypothetical protein